MIQVNVLNRAQPWSQADATDGIRTIARGEYHAYLTAHARQQMLDRDLFTGDLNHVLKNGFVYKEYEKSTQANHFKYCIESTTPNTSRAIRVVVIPSVNPLALKIVTVMWRDEVGIGN